MIRLSIGTFFLSITLPGQTSVLRFEPGLVRIDAVVTSAAGAPVRDLRTEDLRVTQDGKARKLTELKYVTAAPRTIVLFVNDANMAPADLVRTRDALGRFVNDRLKPEDRVALVTTMGGSAYPRQFSVGRRQLRSAIDDLHWRPSLPDALVLPRVIDLLKRTITSLADVEGRKCLMILSDDLLPGSFDVRAIADTASRASVVLDTIDTRAVSVPQSAGSENFLEPLAIATGGLVRSSGLDLDAALDAALEDQSGFYTLSWDPGPALQQLWGWAVYHRVEVKSVRPGLAVRSRAGFFGVSGPAAQPMSSSRSQQVINAIYSPLAKQQMSVTVTPVVRQHGKDLYVQSLIHVRAGIELIKAEGPGSEGCFIASLAVYSSQRRLTDPEGRQPLTARGARVRLCGEYAHFVLEEGLICSIEDKVEIGGPYQTYVGVRNGSLDAGSLSGNRTNALIRRADWKEEIAKLGSANEFIEVPEPGSEAVSRFTLGGLHAPSKTSGAEPPPSITFRTVSEDDPAIRAFRVGETLVYPASAPARIQILRDGEVVQTAEAMGSFRLDASFRPGQYVLRVVGSGEPGKNEQWSDFKIVN